MPDLNRMLSDVQDPAAREAIKELWRIVGMELRQLDSKIMTVASQADTAIKRLNDLDRAFRDASRR